MGTVAGVGVGAVAVGSMRCSRSEALAGGGGRELLNSEAITEAIRPFNPQGEFGAPAAVGVAPREREAGGRRPTSRLESPDVVEIR